MNKIFKRALSFALALVTVAMPMLVNSSAAFIITDYAMISGGVSHSLAILENGKVGAWGANSQKQLGSDDTSFVTEHMTEVPGIASAVAVAAGGNYSAALTSSGEVYVWGGPTDSAIPQAVPNLYSVVSISAGQMELLALKRDGTVWQWVPGGTPEQVPVLYNIAKISAGSTHYLAMTTYGTVYAWGDNADGRLGDGTEERKATPVKLDLINIVDIAAGYTHSLAVSFDGVLYTWGANNRGQLGVEQAKYSKTPIQVKNIKKVKRVSAGNESSLVLADDGTLYSFGYGEYGQLGVFNTAIEQRTPVNISSAPLDVTQIASGVNHNLCLTSDGTIFAWGRNRDKQTGVLSTANVLSPQKVGHIKANADRYTLDNYLRASAWAIPELEELYKKELVAPMMWCEYSRPITRAELAYLLVSIYENKMHKTANIIKETDFKDIKNHKLHDAINKAYYLGIINGISKTEFAPNHSVTRQEAAKMFSVFYSITRNEQIPLSASDLSYYRDAYTIRSWAIPYVAFAHDKGIINGTDDGRFNPTGLLTNEQALLLVARLEK